MALQTTCVVKTYDPRLIVGWPTAASNSNGWSQAAKVLVQIEVKLVYKPKVKKLLLRKKLGLYNKTKTNTMRKQHLTTLHHVYG